MKKSFGFALALGVAFLGCGGTTRLGSTGDHGGSDSGGTSADTGEPIGSGGAGSGGNPFTGGRRAMGGRGPGGIFGSGGRPATGGLTFGGSGGFDVDASLGGSSDAGLGTAGRFFDAGDDPLRNRVSASQACDRFTTIQCAAERYCCPRADRSFDACMKAMQSFCSQYIDLWTPQPMVAYDIDRSQAALDEFEKRASVCDLSIMPWAMSDAGFRLVARGNVAPGDTCFSLDAGVVGPDALAFLASCSLPEAYACMAIPQENRAVCAPRGAVGDACYTDMNCLDGLFCDAAANQPAACAPRKPDGAPCSTPFGCQSMRCDQQSIDSRCVPATLESAYCLPY